MRAVVAPWPTGWAETLSPCRAAQLTAVTTSSHVLDGDHGGRVLVDVDRPAQAGPVPARGSPAASTRPGRRACSSRRAERRVLVGGRGRRAGR